MADSFCTFDPVSSGQEQPASRRVLVTGAAGHIGRSFAQLAPDRYDLRLMVLHDDADAAPLHGRGDVVEADLLDPPSLVRACTGIDTVLHLAGESAATAAWDSLLPLNIVGAYNLFVAAKTAGCRRVVYASSIHAVSGYPTDRQVKADDPVNPGDLYGVSKCFGEAMGRYMAQQEDLSVIAVRICWFQPQESARSEKGVRMFDTWVSPRDMTDLLCRCIDDTSLRFAIVHGVSDNTFKRLDNSETRDLLGYAPRDNLTVTNDLLAPLGLNKRLRRHDQTGDHARSGIRDELAEAEQAKG